MEIINHSRVKIIFLFAAIFLITLSIMSYVRIKNLIEAAELVNHTQQVKLELENTFTTLINAESNHRGFILSKDTSFLNDFSASISKLNLHLDNVDALTKDNATQLANEKVLRDVIDKRIVYMKSILADATTSTITAQRWLGGKILMDDVRKQIALIENEEQQLLNQRSALLNKETFITPLITIFLIIGAIVILVAAYIKITQELKISDTLKLEVEREQRFRTLANNIQNLAWMAKGDGWIYWYNQRWFDYTGTTQKEMDGWGWEKVHHPDHIKRVVEFVKQAWTKNEPWELTFPLRGVDGEYKWFLTRAYPITDAAGKIIDWIGTNTDIDKQKNKAEILEQAVKERTKAIQQANEELEQSKLQIQTIFEAAPDAVITIDHNGIITNWNVEAENIFGWKKGEAIGKTLTETIIPQRYREQHKNGLNHFLKTGEGRVLNKPVEIHAIKKDNSEIPVELKISASKLYDQQPVFIGFVRDITNRRQNEETIKNKTQQLAESNEELLKANKELESFTYISSHDLQEPLRKIQTFATRIIADEQQNLSAKGKEYFLRMQDAALRMQTLIADLLAYSRTKTAERKFENTDLNKIIDEVKTDLKEELNAKHATIEVGVMCDANVIPFQFRQLMHNLIGNSLKFSKSDTPPHIIIKNEIIKHSQANNANLTPEKEYCHITITDNGIGFEQQYSKKIFEVFQQLNGKTEYHGTGIGLTIVKSIVDNHNGIITATSELNKGARFDIYLPA